MSFNKTTLARQTLLQMAARVAIVIIASTAIGYFHVFSVLESQTKAQLEKYVIERSHREASLFTLAKDNLAELKKELLLQLKERGQQDPQQEFTQLFVKQKDGVTRNRPESFNHKRQAGVFVDDQVSINADIRRRVMTFYNLANTYGPAWHNRFQNTYLMAPENFIVIYWPELSWAQTATANVNIPDEEYFWAANRKHNPQKRGICTGMYYDPLAGLWAVSCLLPVYDGDKHVATIGHDVFLNELIKRTVNDHLKGTYNIIFRKDDRLITHPKLMKQLEKSEGKSDLFKSDEQHLKNIFQLAMGNPAMREAHAAQTGNFPLAAFLNKPVKQSHLYNKLLQIFSEQPLKVAPSPNPSPKIDSQLAQVRPLRILAEDNVVNQKVALLMLQRMEYRADLAGNGLEVLEALNRQPYDLVLMDVQMPEMDGLEATHHIHQKWSNQAVGKTPAPRPRIIAMTANAMQGDREACMYAGMDDYVSKPIQLEALVQALSKCQQKREGYSC